MNKISLVILAFGLSFSMQSQTLIGAWESILTTKEGKQLKNVVIFSESHQVSTWFDAKTGAFVDTNGGAWFLDGKHITETIEFDTKVPERVGTQVSFEIELSQNELKTKDSKRVWTRIDNGTPGELLGAWLMSGRKRNGALQQRDTNRPRKTMKILSGTRFQWIAYNTETKEFSGTGGGTYSTVDGKYIENIEFFSRDDSRVGASLGFNFELIDNAWHHSGLSSKGQPIYEIWSKR
ncbi:MAG: membrane or secreted protein [Flavobacteriaceae bacterium]